VTLGAALVLRVLLADTAQSGSVPPNAIDALIQQGQIDAAVKAFDAQADQTKQYDIEQLARLAKAVLGQASRATASDPSSALSACVTLLAFGPHACGQALANSVNSPATPVGMKLVAASPDLRTGDASAERRLLELTSKFTPHEWAAAVNATAEMPQDAAILVLSHALNTGTPDVQFEAITRLAAIETPRSVELLRPWSGRNDVPGHLVALAAVAGSGDRDALVRLDRELPGLHGSDLLAAGVALARRGDKRGVESITSVLTGPEELLQIEAAGALARFGVPEGSARLEAELGSTNIWLRLRSLEVLQRLPPMLPTPAVWRQMADPLPAVRVRAAQIVLDGCNAKDARAH
jgi:hypothetical protein